MTESPTFNERIVAECEFALHHKSNARNAEAHWRILWTQEFFRGREKAVPKSTLLIAPEHAVLRRNAKKNQPSNLKIKDLPRRSKYADSDESSSGRSVASPSKKTFDKQTYQGKPNPAPLTVHTRSTILSFRPAKPSAPQAPGSSGKTTESTEPSTVPAKQGVDMYRALDFAIIKFSRPSLEAERIFGFNVHSRHAFIPIALELKPPPTRKSSMPEAPSGFQQFLHQALWEAYEDIHKKLPIAFDHDPDDPDDFKQKTIIGIAAAGPWWSFTIASNNLESITWSKALMCGHSAHDEIFHDLLRAAAHDATDPTTYENNTIGGHLDNYKREMYNEEDVLAELLSIPGC
ncbi:hypothetical protein FRC10_000979 [Ceratobasidium sp. 414]|nr:hypothetical protein FRC10_000979 [Ceratobasidium sp. 414]